MAEKNTSELKFWVGGHGFMIPFIINLIQFPTIFPDSPQTILHHALKCNARGLLQFKMRVFRGDFLFILFKYTQM